MDKIRRDNERLFLADYPLIHQFFRLGEERNSVMNSIVGTARVSLPGALAERYLENEEETAALEFELCMKYTLLRVHYRSIAATRYLVDFAGRSD
jgi:hypothetical protein